MSVIFLTWSYLSVAIATTPPTPRTFSSYTGYDAIRGDIRDEVLPSYLKPTQLYLLSRHGARNLGGVNTLYMEQTLALVEQELNLLTPRFSWLKSWVKPPSLPRNKDLVVEGMREQYEMGLRWAERFPSIFPRYTPDMYGNRATYKHRTSQSSSAFLAGLLEGRGPLTPHYTTALESTEEGITLGGFQPVALDISDKNTDILLRFYDNCPVYRESESYRTAEAWLIDFPSSREFQLGAVHPLSSYLGLKFTSEETLGLFHLCALETFSPSSLSAGTRFCEFLPRAVSDYVERYYDVHRYLQLGYPSPVGYRPSCVLLRDLTSALLDPSRKPGPTLRFGHRETVLPLLTLLGVYPNETEFEALDAMAEGLSFAAAQLVPFSGNIAFLLLNDTRPGGGQVVRVYVNERFTPLAHTCPSRDGCTRDDFSAIIGSQGACNFTEMCGYDGPSITMVTALKGSEVTVNIWVLMLLVVFGFTMFCAIIYIVVSWINQKYYYMVTGGYEEVKLLSDRY